MLHHCQNTTFVIIVIMRTMMMDLDKTKYLGEIWIKKYDFALGALDLGISHIAVSRTN